MNASSIILKSETGSFVSEAFSFIKLTGTLNKIYQT